MYTLTGVHRSGVFGGHGHVLGRRVGRTVAEGGTGPTAGRGPPVHQT